MVMIENIMASDSPVNSDPPRQALIRAIQLDQRGLNLKQLSRQLGRNDAYLHQYLTRHSPRHLPELVRYQLAELLQIDERDLRSPEQQQYQAAKNSQVASAGLQQPDMVAIPLLDALGRPENPETFWPFDRGMLAAMASGPVDQIALMPVASDAMAPDLADGDMMMMDQADTDVSLPGLFCIDDGLSIGPRRLILADAPNQSMVRVLSSNPLYANYRRQLTDIRLLGRIIWSARQIR